MYLLAAGAAADLQRIHDRSLLFECVETDALSLLVLLLAAGATVDAELFHSAMTRECRLLLAAAGADTGIWKFADSALMRARRRIDSARTRIDSARKRLHRDRRTLVCAIALPLYIGLQNLRLPAFVTLCILDEALGHRLCELLSMHFKWAVITAVKHFHERKASAGGSL